MEPLRDDERVASALAQQARGVEEERVIDHAAGARIVPCLDAEADALRVACARRVRVVERDRRERIERRRLVRGERRRIDGMREGEDDRLRGAIAVALGERARDAASGRAQEPGRVVGKLDRDAAARRLRRVGDEPVVVREGRDARGVAPVVEGGRGAARRVRRDRELDAGDRSVGRAPRDAARRPGRKLGRRVHHDRPIRQQMVFTPHAAAVALDAEAPARERGGLRGRGELDGEPCRAEHRLVARFGDARHERGRRLR